MKTVNTRFSSLRKYFFLFLTMLNPYFLGAVDGVVDLRGEIDLLSSNPRLARIDWGMSTPYEHNITMGTRLSWLQTTVFLDEKLLGEYGFDWTGFLPLPLSIVGDGLLILNNYLRNPQGEDPGRGSESDGLGLGLVVLPLLTTLPNFIFHPKIFLKVGPVFINTGWHSSLFLWNQKLLLWSPYGEVALGPFGNSGPIFTGRLSYYKAWGTGSGPEILQGAWSWGVGLGWGFE